MYHSYVILGFLLIVVFALTCILLHQYGNWKKQHVSVTTAVFLAWYFSFLIIFILPIDVSSTIYQHCLKNRTDWGSQNINNRTDTEGNSGVSMTGFKNQTTIDAEDTLESNDEGHAEVSGLTSNHYCHRPWSYLNADHLILLWLILYWSTQVLTWFVLPLMQSYAMAGEFTFYGRLLIALKRNIVSYGSYAFVFGILIIYVGLKPDQHLDWEKIYTIMTMAGNTLGLFLLIMLLGHGLVEIPRSCWKASNLDFQLIYAQFKLAKVKAEKTEAEAETADLLERIRIASERIPTEGPLRRDIEVILSKCPEEFRARLTNTNMIGPPVSERPSSTGPVPSEASLISLHNRLITALHKQFKMTAVFLSLLESGFHYEDCLRNRWNSDRIFRSAYPAIRQKWSSKLFTPKMEWFWKCRARQWLLKFTSVLLGIGSILVIWSECTFFVADPVLSIFALVIKHAANQKAYLNMGLVSFCIIAFIAIFAFYTVFHVRIFDYYNLSGHHLTDENSLLYCGILLCRLTPPLCLNFLGLIHMDSHIIQRRTAETAFTRIMGPLKVLPIISRGFNIYFPIFVIVLCCCTFFRWERRCLNFLGYQQYTADGRMTTHYIQEGRKIMQRVHDERRLTQQLEETRAERDELLELVNNTSNFGRVNGESSLIPPGKMLQSSTSQPQVTA